jgi:hypothetical protein
MDEDDEADILLLARLSGGGSSASSAPPPPPAEGGSSASSVRTLRVRRPELDVAAVHEEHELDAIALWNQPRVTASTAAGRGHHAFEAKLKKTSPRT